MYLSEGPNLIEINAKSDSKDPENNKFDSLSFIFLHIYYLEKSFTY